MLQCLLMFLPFRISHLSLARSRMAEGSTTLNPKHYYHRGLNSYQYTPCGPYYKYAIIRSPNPILIIKAPTFNPGFSQGASGFFKGSMSVCYKGSLRIRLWRRIVTFFCSVSINCYISCRCFCQGFERVVLAFLHGSGLSSHHRRNTNGRALTVSTRIFCFLLSYFSCLTMV